MAFFNTITRYAYEKNINLDYPDIGWKPFNYQSFPKSIYTDLTNTEDLYEFIEYLWDHKKPFGKIKTEETPLIVLTERYLGKNNKLSDLILGSFLFGYKDSLTEEGVRLNVLLKYACGEKPKTRWEKEISLVRYPTVDDITQQVYFPVNNNQEKIKVDWACDKQITEVYLD